MSSLSFVAAIVLCIPSMLRAQAVEAPAANGVPATELVDRLPARDVINLMKYEAAMLEKVDLRLSQGQPDALSKEFKVRLQALEDSIARALASAQSLPESRAAVRRDMAAVRSGIRRMDEILTPALDMFDTRGEEYLYTIVPELDRMAAAVDKKLAGS